MRRFTDLGFDDRPTWPRPRERAAWPQPVPAPEPEAAPEAAPAPPTTVPDERASLREATAQLDAARARVERDAAKVLDETRGKLVEQLLPVLDSLDRSITVGGDTGNAQIRAQLEGVLKSFGLERFDAAIGAPFDPREQEAIAVAEVDAARAGTVTAQWQAGYRHAGKLLRAARVQVGRQRS